MLILLRYTFADISIYLNRTSLNFVNSTKEQKQINYYIFKIYKAIKAAYRDSYWLML